MSRCYMHIGMALFVNVSLEKPSRLQSTGQSNLASDVG